jgi:radical SAM superfamily enzyme YgiQ (UPF0313 family)
MKALLLIPPGGHYAERWRHGVLVPPLGVAYLAGVLIEMGIGVEVLDAHVERLSWRGLRREFLSRKPDVVGVSFTTEARFEAFRAIKMARDILRGAFLVAGGPHASLTADETLRHLPELDAIVRGEGEYTLRGLVQKISERNDFSSVLGLSFRDGDQIIHNPDRPVISDLDTLPFPCRDALRLHAYNFHVDVPGEGMLPAASLVTSRGCPSGCCFCASSAMWGPCVRLLSPKRIMEEIVHVTKRYGVRFIWFFDDVFTHRRDRVKEICDLLRQYRPEIRWFCEARVNDLDRDLLSIMRDAGCRRLGLGIESGSEKVLDSVFRKRVDLGQARSILEWCDQLGIIAHPFFILSLPGEEWDDAKQTMAFIRGLSNRHEPSLSLARVYPGTKLEYLARANGTIPQGFSWTLNSRRAATFPGQGNVPVFLDRLSWAQLSELLAEWIEIRRGASLRHLHQVIRHVRSWHDIRCCLRAGVSLLRRRAKHLSQLEAWSRR